jgi:hypothetical protein
VNTFADVSKQLGPIKPEALEVAKEVFTAAKAAGYEVRYLWGYDNDASNTEHHSGLALDFMINDHASGQWIRDYVWTNRERLRLRHAIWEQHITSTVVSPGVVRLMADRGDTTANHMDHVHVLLFEGDYRAPGTSSGSKDTSSPAPNPTPSTSDGLVIDGDLGPKTIAKWQAIMGTPVDGVIDSGYSQLVAAVQRVLQATVNHRLVVDGQGIYQNNKPYHTVAALQSYLRSPVDGILSDPVSQCVMALQRRLNEGRF